MAVEEQRLRVRQSLEEKLGVEEASYLMDRPIGGWSDLVTNHTNASSAADTVEDKNITDTTDPNAFDSLLQ